MVPTPTLTRYLVVDTFRNATVSTHRSITAAFRGERIYGLNRTTVRAIDLGGPPRGSDSVLDSSRELNNQEVNQYLLAVEAWDMS